MPHLSLVIALALAAAYLFALAAHLQRRGSQQVMAGTTASAQESGGAKRLLQGLPANRTWQWGVLANFGAFALQAAALAVGTVATVQPLIATQLLFVLVLASFQQHRWPAVRDGLSAAAVCGGIALLLSTEGRMGLAGHPDRPRIILTVVAVVAVIAVLVAAGRRAPSWLASMLLGTGAGLFQAMSAGFMKLALRDYAHRGLADMLADWPVYAVPVSVLGGVVLGQLAFATGTLPPAVAAMSVTNPVASLAFALFAFEVLPREPAVLAGIAVSGVVIAVGLVGLAASPSTREYLTE
ncbi:DMT family transporter [Mycobacterium sp. SMC-16]|uniref:DMT family transporter n=1 Tax=Mycobacteriaceae TaxID=1762 RepID=UPI000769BF0D|nr:DMT family transporter [Mycolicibacterium mucogenicum]MCX8554560.1 DMT family transporter [Mycolicibacterium mucogenicum]